MLVSWYDRDRDFESPPILPSVRKAAKRMAISLWTEHGATLRVDIEDGRFVLFYRPVEWLNYCKKVVDLTNYYLNVQSTFTFAP